MKTKTSLNTDLTATLGTLSWRRLLHTNTVIQHGEIAEFSYGSAHPTLLNLSKILTCIHYNSNLLKSKRNQEKPPR